MKTAVLTDSTSDLTPEEQQRFRVNVIPLNVAFEGELFLDHRTISSEMIFEGVSRGSQIPSTAPPSQEQYAQAIEILLRSHDQVLSVHLSSRLSETVAVARSVADLYPGRVTVVDSFQASGALAMQAERAVRLLRQGLPPEKVADILGALGHLTCTRMGLDTLEYLKHTGRIGSATALLGGLLRLKPIVGLDDGQVIAVGRERGKRQAHGRLVRELTEQIRRHRAGPARTVVFHNGDQEGAALLEHTATSEGAQVFLTSRLGSVLSSHSGPGVCGFSTEPETVYHQFRAY